MQYLEYKLELLILSITSQPSYAEEGQDPDGLTRVLCPHRDQMTQCDFAEISKCSHQRSHLMQMLQNNGLDLFRADS
jgi:hypothetical protein